MFFGLFYREGMSSSNTADLPEDLGFQRYVMVADAR